MSKYVTKIENYAMISTASETSAGRENGQSLLRRKPKSWMRGSAMKMKVEHRKHAVLGLVLILLLSALVLMASAASSLRYIVSVNSAPVNLRGEPTREARSSTVLIR